MDTNVHANNSEMAANVSFAGSTVNGISPKKPTKITPEKFDDSGWDSDKEEERIFKKVNQEFQSKVKIGTGGSSSISRLGNRIQNRYSFPKSGSEVLITSVHENHPQMMFIRSTDSTIKSIVEDTLLKVEKDHSKEPFLTEAPAKNDLVYTMFEGIYNRARIIEVEGEKAKVFFIDYGNVDTSEWSKFKKMTTEELKKASGHIFKVALIDLNFDANNIVETYQFLNGYCFNEPLVMTYEDDQQTTTKHKSVHLKIKSTEMDLVDEVKRMRMAKASKSMEDYGIVMYSEVNYSQIFLWHYFLAHKLYSVSGARLSPN
jgi:hypothetical protein